MRPLEKQVFVCLDCETTGLDPKNDKVIEIAITKFTLNEVLETFESLVDPKIAIPEESKKIHHISDDMVKGAPLFEEVLPKVLEMAGREPIVGHGIKFDVEMIAAGVEATGKTPVIRNNKQIDTLRLARLYGESPTNSLEMLRKHFNIPEEGAHRAMNDVIVNIEVFRRLSTKFKTLPQLLKTLEKPVLMKAMPLGKHKGRAFKDIPLDYLKWASYKDFDEDLLFSIRTELKRRKQGNLFSQASNPFGSL